MKSQLPHVVLIVIDDLGWRDLGCYGSTFYETPHLDRLAAQGMRFTDAYASSPVCSPSRASLMTGKTPARVGITQFIGGHAYGAVCDVPYFWGLPGSEISLARSLRSHGYQTWHVGKWHLGEHGMSPLAHGFEVNRGGCGWGAPVHGHFSPYRIPTLVDGPDGEYLTDRLTQEAITLIRERRTDSPFFLNLWHYSVHCPIQAPQPLISKYQRKAEAMGIRQDLAIESGGPFGCEHLRGRSIQRRLLQSDPAYAAMIESLDTNIGRLLAALDDAGLSNDTMVIFTSDNGGLSSAEGSPTCNLPLAEGKGWMYEGGTRVCQIVRYPRVVASGSMSSIPTTSCDWYPTILAAGELPPLPEQHVDGVDLMPVLRGGDIPARPLFWHYPHYSNQGGNPSCAIRLGHWKLIEFFDDDHCELYDLQHDLGEHHDRAQAEPERCAAMLRQLRSWQREVSALLPKRNPNWQPIVRPSTCHAPER